MCGYLKYYSSFASQLECTWKLPVECPKSKKGFKKIKGWLISKVQPKLACLTGEVHNCLAPGIAPSFWIEWSEAKEGKVSVLSAVAVKKREFEQEQPALQMRPNKIPSSIALLKDSGTLTFFFLYIPGHLSGDSLEMLPL